MTGLAERAREFAIDAHNSINHRRKYTDAPYTSHLENVAALVAEVTDDETMIAAGYLHDVIEDTPVTADELAEAFGADVAYLVIYLSDISKPSDGNRTARKSIDRAHVARGDHRVHTIKLADLIDNARDIAAHDPKFAAIFMAEKELLLGVLNAGHPDLLRTAWEIVTNYYNGQPLTTL